ncbi:MAG: hypothetical protein DRP78_05545 [Candidatus Omnitrophota bacterium]|nr:MAG: hypothetical protein DRP78_05545 [Candidatus Omnitrophota bacterium]
MHTFYVFPENVSEGYFLIDKQQARHAYLVLRLVVGDEVLAVDGRGMRYLGVIESITSNSAKIKIKQKIFIQPESLEFVLAQAIPKKSKFDSIVDNVTQIGVKTIIPLLTQRTIVKIQDAKKQEKIVRWQKIALETIKQCGSAYVPEIRPITKFMDLVQTINQYDRAFLCACAKDAVSLKTIIKAHKLEGKILVLIGPEGDFSEQEIAQAKLKGAFVVSLGKNVLRSENAAGVILSILHYEWT